MYPTSCHEHKRETTMWHSLCQNQCHPPTYLENPFAETLNLVKDNGCLKHQKPSEEMFLKHTFIRDVMDNFTV